MKPAAIKPLRVSPTSSGSIRVESKISAPSIDSAKPIARTTAASRPDNLISRTGKFFSSKHADFLKHARSCFKVDRAVVGVRARTSILRNVRRKPLFQHRSEPDWRLRSGRSTSGTSDADPNRTDFICAVLRFRGQEGPNGQTLRDNWDTLGPSRERAISRC